MYISVEPIAKLVSGDRLPHFGSFSSWNFAPSVCVNKDVAIINYAASETCSFSIVYSSRRFV